MADPWAGPAQTPGPDPDLDVEAQARRAAAGDRDAFGLLYARYRDELFAYVRRHLPSEEDAEDIVSHAFYKALRSLPHRKPDRSPFNVWLFHLTRNLITDFHRTRREWPSLDGLEPAGHSLEAQVLDRYLASPLEVALGTLTTKQRWVIRLHTIDGLGYDEVAARLGISEGAARALHMRAVRAMREALPGGAAAVDQPA